MADKLQVVVGASVEVTNPQGTVNNILKQLGTIPVPVTIVPDTQGLADFKKAVTTALQGLSNTPMPAMAPTMWY